jgi:hypothetical protein
LGKVGLVLDKPSSGLIFYQLCGPGRNQQLKFQAVRSGREPTGREDKTMKDKPGDSGADGTKEENRD